MNKIKNTMTIDIYLYILNKSLNIFDKNHENILNCVFLSFSEFFC